MAHVRAHLDGGPDGSAQWQGNADVLLRALTRWDRFDSQRGLFFGRARFPGRGLVVRRGSRAGGAYAHLWPFACAWSAMETAATLPGASGARADAAATACLSGLSAYAPDSSHMSAAARPIGFESSVTAPLGVGGEVYYDDNAWVALALLEHHRRFQDPGVLSLAQRVVAFCCAGWSTEPGWASPGGIRWKVPTANRSRNTCANAPVAEAAALVHARTGDPDALEWAVRVYGWVRASLLGPEGLYLDRIMPDGARAPERWTYNQGTMIGAGVLLAQATRDHRYLADAQATAERALAYYDVAALAREASPAFGAIFFRNLLLLDRFAPDPRIRALASTYAARTWAEAPHGLAALAHPRLSLHATAPLVELYALLAGATPHP